MRVSHCFNCLYHSKCVAFHWGSRVCEWYAPLEEDCADEFERENDPDKYYNDYVKYISEFDEDFLYE